MTQPTTPTPLPLTEVGHLSTKKLSAAQGLPIDLRPRKRITLLVYHHGGVAVEPLSDGESLIVGRAHSADIRIRDESLSRQHACVEFIDGEVWVEDLGSTNGTMVDGEPIERWKVGPDSELTMGNVVVAVHARGAGESDEVGLESHDHFRRALEKEVERARSFGRTLALVRIRGGKGAGGHVRRWLAVVRKKLRSFDVPALYSPDTIEVLLPEATAEAGQKLARTVADKVAGLRCGVAAFPRNATSADELLAVVGATLGQATEKERVAVARTTAHAVVEADADDENAPVAQSPAMLRVLDSAKRFAGTAMPVLIRGETGTGKEVVARIIHEAGKRRDKPMICVNCGAIPSQLVESTLFGHEKGAFTGANQLSKGVFESAQGGTVLLDEIGEMPLEAQAVLLRVLETKQISRVGSTRVIDIDVRVIAATHRDLEEMCDAKTFRRDLFYRLEAMAVHIAPLRKRTEDIAPLVARFVASANRDNERNVQGIDAEALALIMGHSWPGNVRELHNTIERAVVIAQTESLTVDDLPDRIRKLDPQSRAREMSDAPAGAVEAAPDATLGLKAAVAAFEANMVRDALTSAGWDRKQAAKTLALPLRTLTFKIHQHNIKKPD